MGVKVRTIGDSVNSTQTGDVIDVGEKAARLLIDQGWVEDVDEASVEPTYRPWPIEGCTLDEAVKRTADPDLWKSLLTSRSDLAAAGGRRTRRVLSFGISDYVSHEDMMREREGRERDRLEQCVRQVEDKIRVAFGRLLIEGILVAQGSYKTPSANPSVIRSGAWNDIGIHNWQNSIAVECTPEKARWYDVRVFPALHSPDAWQRISGLSLNELFHRFVFGDSEVVAAAKRRMPADRFEMIFGDRKFSRLDELKWPLDCAVSPHAYQPINMKSYWEPNQHTEVTVPFALVSEIVEHRLKALKTMFTSRGVASSGTFAATGQCTQIGRLEWDRIAIWIDLRNNDLVEEVKEGQRNVRWTGISIEAAAPTTGGRGQVVDRSDRDLGYDISRETDSVRRSTVADGTRTQAGSAKAVAQVRSSHLVEDACYEWLVQEIKSSKGEKVATKGIWLTKALARWPGALSKGRFKAAWDRAIRDTSATKWSASGAPRKSTR